MVAEDHIDSASSSSFCCCRLFSSFFTWPVMFDRGGEVVFVVVGRLVLGFLFRAYAQRSPQRLGHQLPGGSAFRVIPRSLWEASAQDARAGGTIGTGNEAPADIGDVIPISIVVLWMDLPVWIEAVVRSPRSGAASSSSFSDNSQRRLARGIVAGRFVTIIAVRAVETYPEEGLLSWLLWSSFFSSHSRAIGPGRGPDSVSSSYSLKAEGNALISR